MKYFVKYLFSIITLVYILFISSCNRSKPILTFDTEFTTLPLPDGEYGGVAWFDEFLIIESLSTNGERHAYSSGLWKMDLDNLELEPLSFPNYPGCGIDG